jgi:hypothetical protein
MTSEELIWISGLSLSIGGFLTTTGWICFAIIDPSHRNYRQRYWFPLNSFIIAGGLFVSLGLPGLYVRQASEASVWGLIGFILLFPGLILSRLAVHSIETACIPNIPKMMMRLVLIAAPSLFSGILVPEIAIWKAEICPQSLGIFLIISAIVGLLTVIKGIPQWLGRNLNSSFFPISMVWAGNNY